MYMLVNTPLSQCRGPRKTWPYLNEPVLQYRMRPVDGSGAVSGLKQPCSFTLLQPLLLWCYSHYIHKLCYKKTKINKKNHIILESNHAQLIVL